ncbi:MAG: hypothetical protein BWY69_00102 [Planctomycetes bacterium ADurb.Bin401]|nr:MAG: hypothetical protein BWY69_00102 [Planctomycetes bacterium ADurb.Bin401]
MGMKKNNYIELYIDKIIIAAAAILALIILFVFVIKGPSVDGAGPSEIDDAIHQKALRLEERMNSEPNENIKYTSKQVEFLSLLKDPISKDVNEKIYYPLAGESARLDSDSKFAYKIPAVGRIEKPTSSVVRMAAFVPSEELSMTVAYDTAEKTIEDLDLVTIESSIDVKSLYSRFKEAFAGKNIPADRRKEQYAKPVFAKVQLQRKSQQADGNWSDWSDVPYTKICNLKKNLAIPEAIEYAVEMALVQFARNEFRTAVLQPDVYCDALPTDVWISPSFYNKRQVKLEKHKDEIRRQEMEAEKTRRLQERTTPSRVTRETRTPARGVEDTMAPGFGRTRESPSRTTSRRETTPRQPATRRQPVERERPARPDRNVTNAPVLPDITEEADFDAIKIKPEISLDSFDKLVFWAHDDTAKPGEKYQYRIRIGVFNPIAGRDLVAEDQKEYRDEVVLWSDFAEVNSTVEIPHRSYFFPLEVRDTSKGTSTDKTVEVLVAKYMLGNWVTKKYMLKNGEEIGKADEEPDARLADAGINSDPIDFSTGAALVDTRLISELSGTGTLRPRDYYEIMYSYDGNEIQKMPVKEKNWPANTTKIYKDITAAIEAPPVVLLSWEQASSGMNRSTPSYQPGIDNERMPMQPGGMPGMPEGMPGSPPMPFMP